MLKAGSGYGLSHALTSMHLRHLPFVIENIMPLQTLIAQKERYITELIHSRVATQSAALEYYGSHTGTAVT